MFGRSPLVLRGFDARDAPGGARVECLADGQAVFFESDDAPLQASPEGFASAFLLPAAARRRRLAVEAPLDGPWLEGAARWREVVRSWWGYRASPPRAAGAPPRPRRHGVETALLFSGGVDSFHTLLCEESEPSLLVYVQGFDRALDDDALLPPIRAMLADVAAARGALAVILRTNLRAHPAFACVTWERTHGGALACVGHVLGPAVGRLLISATFAGADAPPWGSHARLDTHLSSSGLAIAHAGTDRRRSAKLVRLADEPLVQKHLRVCWASTGPTYNCSRCDKCLVTMLVLREAGRLADFAVFEPPTDFAAAFDALPKTIYRKTVREIRAATDDPRLGRALEDLDRRSGTHPAYDR